MKNKEMKKKLSASIDQATYDKIVREAEKQGMKISTYVNSVLGNKREIKNAKLMEFYEFKCQMSTKLNKRKYMLKTENTVEAKEIDKEIRMEVEKLCRS